MAAVRHSGKKGGSVGARMGCMAPEACLLSLLTCHLQVPVARDCSFPMTFCLPVFCGLAFKLPIDKS